MTQHIFNLVDLSYVIPQATNRIKDLILYLAFEGELTDDHAKKDWDMDKSLKDFGQMIRGITYAKSDSKKDPAESFIPLLGAANIQQKINYSNLTYVPSELVKVNQIIIDGDVLICMSSGSKNLVGKAAMVYNPIHASFGAFCAVYRPSDLIDREFLDLFFQSPKYRREISHSSRGIGINNLRIGDIESIQIPLPPMKKQREITKAVNELLSSCDELESSLNSRAHLANTIRRSALDAVSTAQSLGELQMAWNRIQLNWEILTDSRESISDLRALILKLAMRGAIGGINDASISAEQELSSVDKNEVREVFLKNCSESDLYPRNWAIATFPNIGQWVSGCGFPTSEQGHKDREILFVKVSDMNLPNNSKYLVEANNSVDSLTASKLRATVLDKGTVVFPKIGGAIATNKRRLITKPTIVDNNCMGIAPCSVIDSEWLFLLLSSIDFAQYQSGTSIPSLSQRILDQIHFGVPPLVEQRLIVQKVNQLMQLCDELEKSILERSQVAEKFSRSVVSISA